MNDLILIFKCTGENSYNRTVRLYFTLDGETSEASSRGETLAITRERIEGSRRDGTENADVARRAA